MIKINVPVLGESVSSATVAKIHKKEGEYVNVDELVFELETDKVTLEVSASSNGIIHSLKVAQGDNDGRVLAYILAATKQPLGFIQALDTEDLGVSQSIAVFFL